MPDSAAPSVLKGRDRELVLDRPRIMGILNLTPDSFYDGGRYRGLDAALRRVEQMVGEGADLIDIGGESTRPGAPAVSVDEELTRVVPVVEAIVRRFDIPLSIDTTKAKVAAACLAAGAHFVNDISGLTFDPEILVPVVRHRAGLFLMHTPARPEIMQQRTAYADVCQEVIAFLREALARARAAGVPKDHLAVDPGIGFGKDLDGNLQLLGRLDEIAGLGVPVLLGTSRKSFIGRILGLEDPGDRLYGTLATVALGVSRGVMIHRVHDVRPARETALVAWAIERGGSGRGT
ncbi:dihydropteroate synthase [Geothermobacter ehrlichii]|uniref:Dihydropteroate synthase n=1 Tax=Geothermobacter ehrlichii TaxID=213224 RepID=A0A5D3WGT8_9BACT|nr:dihydropteroate synthase [Geothermobacter ehrlichii]TYO95683.1 dihydropteroate synthase [Geothermobacter ehrlichii]